MLLKRKVDGGVLIYAMLMAALFAILLQFYLDRLVASQRQSLAMQENSKAYLVAQMAQSAYEKDPTSHQFQYNVGQAQVVKEKDTMVVEVVLVETGHRYRFEFFPSHQESKPTSSTSTSSQSSKASSSKASSSSDQSSEASHSSSSSKNKASTSHTSSTSESKQEPSHTGSITQESVTETSP